MENQPIQRADNEMHTLPPQAHNSKTSYQFTAEELRVLKDCNRESFYQRSLPLCALFSGSVYYGIQTGYFKGHAKYGATPKIIAAVILGYFAGKFSYQRKCAEKLMLLPNSTIGEMLRQKKRGKLHETLEPGFGPAMSLSPFSGMGSSKTYSDLNPDNSLDFDTTRPELEGLDDSHRPSLDNQIYEEEMPPVQKHETTYDELRKRNRDEYQQKRMGNFRQSETYSQSPTSARSSHKEQDVDRQSRNKYGDVFD